MQFLCFPYSLSREMKTRVVSVVDCLVLPELPFIDESRHGLVNQHLLSLMLLLSSNEVDLYKDYTMILLRDATEKDSLKTHIQGGRSTQEDESGETSEGSGEKMEGTGAGI